MQKTSGTRRANVTQLTRAWYILSARYACIECTSFRDYIHQSHPTHLVPLSGLIKSARKPTRFKANRFKSEVVVLDTIRRVLLPSATRCRLGELAEQQQQPCLCVYTGHERRPARQILWVCTLSPARRNPEQANGIQFVRDDGGRHGGGVSFWLSTLLLLPPL